MKKINLKGRDIKIHNILFAYTSHIDYEMERYIMLDYNNLEGLDDIEEQLNYSGDKYVIIEGTHCSCYDFDDTQWEAIAYTEEELKKLCNGSYDGHKFYEMIKRHFEF